MKKLLLIAVLLFVTGQLFAQTDGLSYQAVIINPNIQEIPGVDVSGNILPNTTVSIRFTIIDSNNLVEYQEVQTTTTDQFGMINLLIGVVDHDAFTLISWDGTNKELKVEIDFNGGSSFVALSREELTFLPYASHRNITASGTLNVDEATFLNGELTVEEPTHLNSTLDVNNNSASNLTGDLTVGGATIIEGTTNLNSSLDVNNKSITNLSGHLNVGEDLEPNPLGTPFDADASTKLNGTLSVVGKSNFTVQETSGLAVFGPLEADDLTVNFSSTLNGDNKLIGDNYLEGGKNTLVGDNLFKGIAVGDANTFEGVNVLSGKNTIGNSYSDELSIKGKLSVDTDKQITISSTHDQNGTGVSTASYPVLISGSNQGLAIQVNKTNSQNSNKNHYVSFYTSDGLMQGRIQGETHAEMVGNLDYIYELRQRDFDLASGIIDVAFATYDLVVAVAEAISAASSTTACAGFGAVVCSPIPSLIVENTAQAIAAGILEVFVIAKVAVSASWRQDWIDKMANERGVTYQSDAGDYAEYLFRADINEEMTYGDIVGVIGGEVSKNTFGAERMMVVSYKPIVLGNMPQASKENEYEKIAFMGQVPVKVFGKVNIGDYILPRGYNDGTGIAIAPSNIKAKDINKIVGVAWESVGANNGFNMINVAVGLNANDNNPIVEKLELQVSEQAEEISGLKQQIAEIITRLVQQETGVSAPVINQVAKNDETHTTQDSNIVYHEITQEDLDLGLKMAEDQMRASGMDLENNPLFKQLKMDPNYKAELLKTLQVKFKNAIHYHKELDAKVNPNY